MNKEQIQKLLDLIVELVDDKDGGPWQTKMAAVQFVADEHEMTCLEEFCSWFGVDPQFEEPKNEPTT